MKIATLGTGGIGGYLAVKLSLSGFKVATVARGDHLKAIKENGLVLKTENNVERVHPWIATDDPKEVGEVDAVIFGVKGYALVSAAKSCKYFLGDQTIVVPFLNGVEASERLGKIIPSSHVANGLAQISTTITSPGVIQQTGTFANFIFSEQDNRCSSRIKDLQLAIKASGSGAPETQDIDKAVWEKFVLFSAMSGITAAARCNIGSILTYEPLKELFMDVMKETANTGRARGINLSESIEKDIWERVVKMPTSMRASTAIDLEKGLPLEIDWVSGAVSRLAKQVGLSAPANEVIYSLLSPFKNGAN